MANGLKMWKGNWKTTTLLFSLKELELLYQGRRGHVKTIVMEHFNSILFHIQDLLNKQHGYQVIILVNVRDCPYTRTAAQLVIIEIVGPTLTTT